MAMHYIPFLSEDTDLYEYEITPYGLAPKGLKPPPKKRKPTSSDGLHDIPAAAIKLNITQEKVRAFVRDGELKYINVGHGEKRPRYRFTESDINELIEKRKTQETPCQSSGPKSQRRITGTDSKSVVVGFMEARNARLEKKPKNSKR
jgi:hypothetical protein